MWIGYRLRTASSRTSGPTQQDQEVEASRSRLPGKVADALIQDLELDKKRGDRVEKTVREAHVQWRWLGQSSNGRSRNTNQQPRYSRADEVKECCNIMTRARMLNDIEMLATNRKIGHNSDTRVNTWNDSLTTTLPIVFCVSGSVGGKGPDGGKATRIRAIQGARMLALRSHEKP